MTVYAPDAYCTPVVLTTANNVFRLVEDPGGAANVIRVTVDAGTWFLHADSGYHATRQGLYHAIQFLLNNGTTAGLGSVAGVPVNSNYAFEVATPTLSTGLTNNGLALRVSSANDFEISFIHVDFTMDARVFGLKTESGGSVTSAAQGLGVELATMPAATRHRLVTRDLIDGYAVDKVRRNYVDVSYSSTRPSDAVAVIWDEGYLRRIRYEDVPGVEVHETRASESEWAQTTGRSTGDMNATWYDVWVTLRDTDEVLIVHNSTADLLVAAHEHEVAKLFTPLPWEQFAQSISLSGDYYNISMPLWVDQTASDYGH